MVEQINDSTPQIDKAPTPEILSKRWKLFRSFGRTGLRPNIQINTGHAPLAEGYRFEDPGKIQPLELAMLLRQVEIGRHVKDDYLQTRNQAMHAEGLEVLNVGVRSTDGNLVGFGSVAYRENSGELCDFVVSPEHQSRGIGKAIIVERLNMAELAGITSLSIPNLESTNTLRSYYLEQGFRETTAGGMVRGPNPIVSSGIQHEQLAAIA